MANFRMARNMPHVIHVGPCDSPGGIRTVMRTLAEHPPEGWTASLLASHSSTHIGMLRAARQAARALRRLPDDASTLVHLHAASDWSLRRSLRLAACIVEFQRASGADEIGVAPRNQKVASIGAKLYSSSEKICLRKLGF